MEPPTSAPPEGTNYDFILNPEKPAKRKAVGGMGGDSFIIKILFIVGGTVILMVVAAFLVNLFLGNRTNLDALVGLAQSEQEIVRLSEKGKDATSQDIKNAAVNTQLSVKSHQSDWLAYLGERGREVKDKELDLKKSASADKRLETAKQASLFDNTYANMMRSELTDYAKALKSAYDGSVVKEEKSILNKHYAGVQLLFK